MKRSNRYGAKIEISGFDFSGATFWTPATIVKPKRESLPMPGDDWNIVQYADGGKLCVHDSRIRYVS